jgi:hypothetical protein
MRSQNSEHLQITHEEFHFVILLDHVQSFHALRLLTSPVTTGEQEGASQLQSCQILQ